MTRLKASQYKKRTMTVWNEVAPRYHKRWAGRATGPFQSTAKLVSLSEIKSGDSVLDMACGTGVVTEQISRTVREKGNVTSFDISKTALDVAKRFCRTKKNIQFFLGDAENFPLKTKFDAVTCQYALFFFPNSKKALYNAKRVLKDGGTLAISVHGHNAPFFTCIMKAMVQFIPDYVPAGTPKLDRFGSQRALHQEIKKCGFVKIKTKSFVFQYSPGKFDEYWQNYLRYVVRSQREKIDALSKQQRESLKNAIQENAVPYTKKNGKLVFPWQVIVAIAKK